MRSLASYLAKIESSDALLSDSSIGIEIRRHGDKWRSLEVWDDKWGCVRVREIVGKRIASVVVVCVGGC